MLVKPKNMGQLQPMTFVGLVNDNLSDASVGIFSS
jgi:hypothetical protein